VIIAEMRGPGQQNIFPIFLTFTLIMGTFPQSIGRVISSNLGLLAITGFKTKSLL